MRATLLTLMLLIASAAGAEDTAPVCGAWWARWRALRSVEEVRKRVALKHTS